MYGTVAYYSVLDGEIWVLIASVPDLRTLFTIVGKSSLEPL